MPHKKVQPTSRIANTEMEVSGKKLTMQQKILADLITNGEGTKDKVALRLCVSPEQVHKRFSELVKQGLVVDTGRKGILNSGLPGIVWCAKYSDKQIVASIEKTKEANKQALQSLKENYKIEDVEYWRKNIREPLLSFLDDVAKKPHMPVMFSFPDDVPEMPTMISPSIGQPEDQPYWLLDSVYAIKPILSHEETRSIVRDAETIKLKPMPAGEITIENFNKPLSTQLDIFGGELFVSD